MEGSFYKNLIKHRQRLIKNIIAEKFLDSYANNEHIDLTRIVG